MKIPPSINKKKMKENPFYRWKSIIVDNKMWNNNLYILTSNKTNWTHIENAFFPKKENAFPFCTEATFQTHNVDTV